MKAFSFIFIPLLLLLNGCFVFKPSGERLRGGLELKGATKELVVTGIEGYREYRFTVTLLNPKGKEVDFEELNTFYCIRHPRVEKRGNEIILIASCDVSEAMPENENYIGYGGILSYSINGKQFEYLFPEFEEIEADVHLPE